MECITFDDFTELSKPNQEYYAGRWVYFQEVIRMIEEIKPQSVLELGPALFPVVRNADIMRKPEIDLWGVPSRVQSTEYLHDATKTPWPIDRTYDLFIALQVFEHLTGSQMQAFQEVKRIARRAILSLPYRWDCPKDNANYPEHHMIDENTILQWTRGEAPEKWVYIERTGAKVSKGERIIGLWKF
ncbi:MAG: hypothetical protein LBJ11_11475 [Oscillospiraceae bacterium]|jgi:hypothetical protein|nr:hypothetical protein [Oscillospiraceae bacterium]